MQPVCGSLASTGASGTSGIHRDKSGASSRWARAPARGIMGPMRPLAPVAVRASAGLWLAATLSALAAQEPTSPRPLEIPALDGSDLLAWSRAILPEPVELTFEGIPWHPQLAPGFLAANQAQKPVLLWVMNGHPLGCT